MIFDNSLIKERIKLKPFLKLFKEDLQFAKGMGKKTRRSAAFACLVVVAFDGVFSNREVGREMNKTVRKGLFGTSSDS